MVTQPTAFNLVISFIPYCNTCFKKLNFEGANSNKFASQVASAALRGGQDIALAVPESSRWLFGS